MAVSLDQTMAHPSRSLLGHNSLGRRSERGWDFPSDLSREEWIAIGRELGRAERGISWWIGDWWAFGEHRYGDRKAIVEAPDWQGPAFQVCENYASIARNFATSRRREVLSFKHHAEVASLPPEDADRLLDWCEQGDPETGEVRPTRELRDEVRKVKRALTQADWTPDQLERRDRAEAGECVVASMRDNGNGQRVDEALLSWAEKEGRLVRVDRQSAFGNPFIIPDDGDRADVIDKFEVFYWPNKPALLDQIATWSGGKVLVCWCHPERCHANVIAATANAVLRGEGTPQEVADAIADHDG